MTDALPCVVTPYARFLENQDRRRGLAAEPVEQDPVVAVQLELPNETTSAERPA